MEYFRTSNGQIQADLARRLGTVLKQYHSQIQGDEKYEVSLCLSILQTLLTNCAELFIRLGPAKIRSNPRFQYPINKSEWGFDQDNVVSNSFIDSKTNSIQIVNAEFAIRCIRNSMSHPTELHLGRSILTTGYTTLSNGKEIEKIRFVQSIWVDNSGLRQRQPHPHLLKTSGLKNQVFQIDFTPSNLLQFTYALATYLAHPLKKEWDGQTFILPKLAA